MNIGEAVKERIIELCRERDISINKLCNMSGVTQSTVNNIVRGRNNSATISTIKSYAMAWVSRFRSFCVKSVYRVGAGDRIIWAATATMPPPPDVISPNALFLGLILRNCSLFFLPPHNELSHLPFFCVLSKQTRCFLLGAEQHNKRWLLLHGVL